MLFCNFYLKHMDITAISLHSEKYWRCKFNHNNFPQDLSLMEGSLRQIGLQLWRIMSTLTHAIVSYKSACSACSTALELDPHVMSCSDVAGYVIPTVYTNQWSYCTIFTQLYIVFIAEITCFQFKQTEAYQHAITCGYRNTESVLGIV